METKMRKKTLLERYGIPIQNLDFGYIAECKDSRIMEKIVQILRSGEEGYFPDLTKCAENKLKELKPTSRLFRLEEKILSRESININEIKPIYNWTNDIKNTDSLLQKLSVIDKNDGNFNTNQLPIRKAGVIKQTKDKESIGISELNINKNSKNCKLISSTDYNKWDKYDPDEEILSMDLADERLQEEIERKNHINKQKYYSNIDETKDNHKKILEQYHSLSHIEKQNFAEDFRLRGNDFYRVKEYDNALLEYTKAIEIYPIKAAAAYNNRALTNFKLKKYRDSIKDCEECLKLEPNNVKARLRLADATYANGRKRESYDLYVRVLDLDIQNELALKAIRNLRDEYEDLPPPNATRLKINDESKQKRCIYEENQENMKIDKSNLSNEINKKMENIIEKPLENYNLAELVKPTRLVKNKLQTAVETLNKLQITPENKSTMQKSENTINPKMNELNLLLPTNNVSNKNTNNNKLLIEEL